MALAHPTRNALYSALLEADEMSTVMLQKSTGVTRYHLYHHLQTLAKNDLVENHRDVGRARWWRVKTRVDMGTSAAPAAAPTPATSAPSSALLDQIPEAARALLDETELDAETIVKKSLQVAADICIYTNHNATVETL